ncbi:MAG: helix-turn-helix transcriptional regulator [Roseburia sp.]
MNTRIKKLRKELDLTQTEFAKAIGLVQNTITSYEKGRLTPSDQTILSICREFNVNEIWLRTGEGEMFNPSAESTLDTLAQERNLSINDRILVEKFLNLTQNKRDAITSYIMECAAEMNAAGITPDYPATPEEFEKLYPPINPTDKKQIS